MIRVEDVHKRYGRVRALGGVSFEVADGETFGIIGPNGAGKSTILKILLGLVRPDRGTVRVDGLALHEDPVGARARIGYVPQSDGFEDASTGRESLTFIARLRGVSPSGLETYAEAMDMGDLLDRRVGTLSGGQRQKLSLAAALIGDPPVLLLDEPTASLDPRATAGFRGLVQKLASEGRTIVLCSHLLADVERLCRRVLILLDGRVGAIEPGRAATPSELFLDVENTARARSILARFGARVSWVNGSGLRTAMPDGEKIRLLAALERGGVPIRVLETRRPGLEERFLDATREENDETAG